MTNSKARQPTGRITKLPRVPQGERIFALPANNPINPIPGSKIQKRPLTRRQPPASSSSQIVYVSSSTPLMSAVKRVTKTLDASLRTAAAPKGAGLQSRIDHLQRQVSRDEKAGGRGGKTEVKVMGTGRAVEKVLAVAGRLEGEGLYRVEVRTGTRGTVDDVVDEDGEEEGRVRRVSVLELAVTLK